MVARNTVHSSKRDYSNGAQCASDSYKKSTAQSEERTNGRLIKSRFHLPVRVDKRVQAQKMVNELQKSPLGRLISAIAMTPDLRPEKIEQGKKILRCSNAELKEKLIEAMERVLEELSYTG